jgi:hypothetical protein
VIIAYFPPGHRLHYICAIIYSRQAIDVPIIHTPGAKMYRPQDHHRVFIDPPLIIAALIVAGHHSLKKKEIASDVYVVREMKNVSFLNQICFCRK